MKVLVADVGGTHVKAPCDRAKKPRKFLPGPRSRLSRWCPKSNCSFLIGSTTPCRCYLDYPGTSVIAIWDRPVARNPHNLGSGWVGFDFAAAFGRPVKIINDAAMQAIGSYRAGKMLFLGLGTGLGSAMIVDGIVEPMELGHLPYKKGTYEDYVGLRGLEQNGKKQWRRDVADAVGALIAALQPDDTVLAEAMSKNLKSCLPTAAQVTTRMPSRADFDCGTRRPFFARHEVRGKKEEAGNADTPGKTQHCGRLARARRGMPLKIIKEDA